MSSASPEPGSFRDRGSRVFYLGDTVLRGLTPQAAEDWAALADTRFFRRFTAEGKVVHTEQVDIRQLSESSPRTAWAGVLRHQRIPFVSYVYEWCFGMLKDAALLHLELLAAAVAEGMILKDASPFNVQWIGTRPIFIDVPSFERLEPGAPWAAYRQFCEMFLYPLLLQAYRHIPFHPWLRGRLDGIEAGDCLNLLGARDLLRPGVLTHVYLQAKAQARFARTSRHVKRELAQAGFHPALIVANAQRLARLIHGLMWDPPPSAWSTYAIHDSYTAAEHEQKTAFVRDIVGSRRWRLVWDLGCNDGTFTRLAAEHAAHVVAMDADHLVIERLYRALRTESVGYNVLPLVTNLADPPPALGWRGTERKTLAARGTPDLTLCLALIHHLVITANIPLVEFLDWVRTLGTTLVVEFVTKDDPMVRTLLRNKRDDYHEYESGYFETEMARRFHVARCLVLPGGTRSLYVAVPR